MHTTAWTRSLTTVTLGALLVSLPGRAQYTVTNTSGDSSSGSLGSALLQSAGSAANSTNSVSFAEPPFSTPQTITLTGAYAPIVKNTDEGGVTISAPTIVTINDGGYTVFTFSGGNDFSLANLSLQGTGTGLDLGTGVDLYLNNVTVADGVTIGGNDISAAAGTTSTFSGKVTGSGGLTENGSGTLVLSSTSNNYTGGTGVTGGGTVSISTIPPWVRRAAALGSITARF